MMRIFTQLVNIIRLIRGINILRVIRYKKDIYLLFIAQQLELQFLHFYVINKIH